MFGNHFYHAAIRRTVAVFGTLFNDINVIRKGNDGSAKSIVKVPLAYGPKPVISCKTRPAIEF